MAILLLCISPCCHAQTIICYNGYPSDTLRGNVKKMVEHSRLDWLDWPITSIYTYDSAKKVETASFYGNDGLRGTWVVQFDSGGRITETALADGQAPPCQQTVSKYDGRGRKIEERSFGKGCGITDWLLRSAGGNPVTGIDSSYNVTYYHYDDAGHVTDEFSKGAWFSARSAVINKYGQTIHNEYYKDNGYADNGRISKVTKKTIKFYPDNELLGLLDHSDTTIDEIESYLYDGAGNKVVETMIKASDDNQGKMEVIKTFYRYNTLHQLLEERSYFNVPRAPADAGFRTKVGGGREYTYDSLANMISVLDYDLYKGPDGKEIKEVTDYRKLDPNPAAKEYDQHGNLVKIKSGTFIYVSRKIEYY